MNWIIALLKALFGCKQPATSAPQPQRNLYMAVDPVTAGIETVGQVAEAVGSVSKEITQRDAEKNAPDVKAGAIAVEKQKAIDQANKAVAEGDLNEIRKEDAE